MADAEALHPPAPFHFATRAGPVTRKRQRSTLLLYTFIAAVGLLLALAQTDPALRAFGIGLVLPGGGFLLLGGWHIATFGLVLLLFAVAIFAWFGAGMLIAPIAIWLGAALLAASLAGEQLWEPGIFVAIGCAAVIGATARIRVLRRRTREHTDGQRRAAMVGDALIAAEQRAETRPDPTDRELSEDDLQGLRYLLDRALQPVDEFGGFELIDIFQTASVRYQINLTGYALAITHAQYMPSFQGYMADAQRRLIEKYLQRKVWIYWPFEASWGHFNFTNWDPAGCDNIMLTGFFGAQVALYAGNTRDDRYDEPGSLTFALSKRRKWQHSVHSICESVYRNMTRSPFALYPCEPNWIYPACNFRGMMTLTAHDRVFGTDYVARTRDRFFAGLDAEFTDGAGAVIGLRSSLTGLAFPFPTGDAGYAMICNTFDRRRAWRLWSLAGTELRGAIVNRDGQDILMLPDKGIDFGNYRPGNLTLALGSLLNISGEFGDRELQRIVRTTLDVRCGRRVAGGVASYPSGSNTANIYAASGGAMRRDDYRATFVDGPPETAFTGPFLAGASYPDVLVARAHGDGTDLDLVLYPGGAPGPQRIRIERLVVGGQYRVECAASQTVRADAAGVVEIDVELRGRTPVRISPVQ